MSISPKFLPVCTQCKAFCCSLVKPPLTEKERNKIIDAGFADHFMKLDEGIYTIKTLKNESCPYLKDDFSCEIHRVKPTLCRVWPIIPRYKNNKRGCIVVKCPIYPSLSKKQLESSKKEANAIPLPLITHLWNISPETKKKYKRFEYEEI